VVVGAPSRPQEDHHPGPTPSHTLLLLLLLLLQPPPKVQPAVCCTRCAQSESEPRNRNQNRAIGTRTAHSSLVFIRDTFSKLKTRLAHEVHMNETYTHHVVTDMVVLLASPIFRDYIIRLLVISYETLHQVRTPPG